MIAIVMHGWVHARVIECPETDSQACCLQTNLAILKRPSTLPLKPCMAKLKRPLLSQMAQRVGPDLFHFTQLLENDFYTFYSGVFLLYSSSAKWHYRSPLFALCLLRDFLYPMGMVR